tara:strand:- start:61 stop:441 length:381 start_codon:yes stop_codon:yes gene_type:complete
MNDQDEPERLSHEWHARAADDDELSWDQELDGRGPYLFAIGEAESCRDRAAKLRQAAKDRTELEVLRNYARDGDGMQCEYCDTVCIDGVDDSEDWGTDRDEDERIRLCYRCSEKEHLKHTKEKTDG